MKKYLGLICLFAAFFSSAHFVELFEEDTLLSFDEFKIKFSKIYSDVENYERYFSSIDEFFNQTEMTCDVIFLLRKKTSYIREKCGLY